MVLDDVYIGMEHFCFKSSSYLFSFMLQIPSTTFFWDTQYIFTYRSINIIITFIIRIILPRKHFYFIVTEKWNTQGRN